MFLISNSNVSNSFFRFDIMDDQQTGEEGITQSSAENKHPPKQTGKRKVIKPRSKAWEHFTKYINDAGEVKAKCNYCGKDLAGDSKNNGTASLINHADICTEKPPLEDLKQSQLCFDAESKTGLGTWKFEQDVVRKFLAYMIIMDELPFKFVEGNGFKLFMSK